MKHMLKFTAALVMAGAFSANAAVLNDFKVNESVIPGSSAVASTFTADKLTGGYVERFQVTGANTFTTVAYFKIASFFQNDGADLVSPTLLNNFEPAGYQLYGIFSATGTFSASGPNVTFTGGVADFALYADTNSDSGAGANAISFDQTNANNLTVLNTDIGNTDLLLAQSTTLIAGGGASNQRPWQKATSRFCLAVWTVMGTSATVSPLSGLSITWYSSMRGKRLTSIWSSY